MVLALIVVTSFWTIQIQRKESRAYTFQNQQLQTQLLAKNFEVEISKAQQIASWVFSLRTNENQLQKSIQDIFDQSKSSISNVKGVGIFLRASGKWYEYPLDQISSFVLNPSQYSENFIASNGKTSDHFLLFPSKSAVISVRVDLSQIQSQCSGLSVGAFNRNGAPIFGCDPKALQWRKTYPESMKTALSGSFQSGSFEKIENNQSGLWGYSDLSSWGKVISVTDSEVAYRPAYLLGLRIVLLGIMSLGVAMIVSIFVAQKVTRPITIVSEATEKIANGEFDTTIDVKTKDETKTLADSVQSMAQKIKRLIQSEIEKTKLDAQLEVAGTVQKTLIPEPFIELDSVKMTSLYRSADQCGGDWWGYIQGKERVAVLVGDVTGHGYPSALLVATTKGYLSMLQEQVDQKGEITMSASDMLRVLNRVVYDATRSELNMTAQCVLIDFYTGDFTVASAGHNAAYVMNSNSGKIESVNGGGPRLGEALQMQEDLTEGSGTLGKEGHKLILYTDGIQDLGPEEKQLGRKGFKKFLQSKLTKSGEEIIAGAELELIPLNEGRPLLDDITLIVIERKS